MARIKMGWLALTLALWGAALALTGTQELDAQVVERERQEAIWPGEGILEISPELRSRLGLFPEVEGFRVARLFLREGGEPILEIEMLREGRLERERRLLRAEELSAFRSELAALQADAGTRAVFTREGRGSLVLGHTFLGLAYHGWAIPVALDLDSNQAAVATYLLTAGASFYLPYRLTRDRPVSDAHRALSLYGGSRGILSGLFLGDLLSPDQDPDDHGRDDRRFRTRLGAGVVTGTAGGVLGFHAVDRWAPTEGTASFWGAMGDFGIVSGAVLAWVAGPYAEETVVRQEGDLNFEESRTRNRRAGHAMTLAGQAVGLGAGAWLSQSRSYSTGDVAALRSAAVLGAQSGITVVRATGITDDRSIAGGGLALGLGGIYLGDRLLREVELSRGEGLLVNAGHLAGGASALGITYLIVEEIDDHPVLYLATSTVGSILGAGLVWRAVRPEGALRARGGLGSSGGGARWEVDPSALLLSLVHRPSEPVRAPILTVRF